MQGFQIVILILAIGGIVGCTKQSPYQRLEWSPYESSTMDLASVENELKKHPFTSEKTTYTPNGFTSIRRQSYEGFPILGTWVKVNTSSKGSKQFVSARVVSARSESSHPRHAPASFVKNSSEQKMAVLKLTTRNQDWSQLLRIYPAFLPRELRLIPVWAVIGLDQELQLRERLFDAESYSLLGEQKKGSSFQEDVIGLKARVFPDGPKVSSLSVEELNPLFSGASLSDQKVKVFSSSGHNVPVSASPLFFEPESEKFSQVQVFYMLQKANSWFEKKLGWTWAGQLKVETDIGYPKTTNAAFYYGNKIYLGAGDKKTYKDIPLDPSMVIHEAAHSLIDRMSRLPFQGEGGSLNEAYADFFTAVQLNNPKLGEVAFMKGPFRRDLSLVKTWQERNGGLYNDSLIVSSLFWSLQEKMNQETVLNLVLKVLRDLTPDETLNSFRNKLLLQMQISLDPKDQLIVYDLMKQKNWPTQ